ncbi:hypothetical protein GCM10010383_57490 [Streptomyces lomondensis]|uniref:Uncharacterized protein n=2 Tax=Streptomyces lomondensis TaxID=68229 RepID=A0ABQ2XJN5_9ACTN|nr:hypothetical protein GCM10010383_57490 [Streptomyces lomondensis]
MAQGYGAVGGNFRGRSGGRLCGAFQRNEYARYARDTAHKRGKVLCLTGTACLFRAGARRTSSRRAHQAASLRPKASTTRRR